MWCMCMKKRYIMLLSSVAAAKDEGLICHPSGEETDRLYTFRDSVCACTPAHAPVFAWTEGTTQGQQCLSLRNAPVM